MAYVVRFVQRYRAADEQAFLALEQRFAALERNKTSGLPRGRRLRPYAGREPSHTLVWECEFETLVAAHDALARIERSRDHARLLRRQIRYLREAYTEIYEVLEL